MTTVMIITAVAALNPVPRAGDYQHSRRTFLRDFLEKLRDGGFHSLVIAEIGTHFRKAFPVSSV